MGNRTTSDTVKLYNNTAYSNYNSSEAYLASIYPQATNVTFANNLAYFPSATYKAVRDTSKVPGSGFSESNNTTNVNTSPSFSSTTIGPIGFKIAAGSYAVGTGVVVPVWSDFFSVPQTTTRDLGAAIH